MRFIEKKWVRVLISLFGGGLIAEIIHISTGDPNRPTPESSRILPLFYAFIIYIVLTYLPKKKERLNK